MHDICKWCNLNIKQTNDCYILYRIVPCSDTNTLLHSYLPINILPTDSDIPSHAAFRRKEVLQQKTGLAQISTVGMNSRRHKMIHLSHSICYHLIRSNILILPSIHIIYPSIQLSIYPSIHLSLHPSFPLSIYLSIYNIYLSIHRRIYPCIHLSIQPSNVCISIYIHIYIYRLLYIYISFC